MDKITQLLEIIGEDEVLKLALSYNSTDELNDAIIEMVMDEVPNDVIWYYINNYEEDGGQD